MMPPVLYASDCKCFPLAMSARSPFFSLLAAKKSDEKIHCTCYCYDNDSNVQLLQWFRTEKGIDRFSDDNYSCNQNHRSLNACGNEFNFTVTIRMISIPWFC